MRDNQKIVTATFGLVGIFFLIFLIFPLLCIFYNAFVSDAGIQLTTTKNLIKDSTIQASFIGSLTISFQTSLLATFIGFIFAYCVNFTNVFKAYKRLISNLIVLPMLVPTIVYGFAIIYSFGKQGIVTRLLGFQLFDIYSTQGLILGFLIYTVPIAYLLFNNAMGYIDHQYFIVSEIMGDSSLRRFWATIISPLITTIAISLVQTFFLTFTDFGIPASLAGGKKLMATALYNQMIGSVPDFANGSVLALMMLLPALLSALLLFYLKRFEIRYDKRRTFLLPQNRIRDAINFLLTVSYLLVMLATFCSFIIVPFVTNYPYDLAWTFEHMQSALLNSDLLATYVNTLKLALLTSVLGVILAYTCALLVKRSILHPMLVRVLEGLSQLTIAIPGMVLGLSFIFAFSKTSLHYTLTILVIVNLIHFFATPFNLASQALEKMSAHYEQTASLLGDSYIRLLVRVMMPNSKKTLVEMFSYLFTNAMVTISAIIFLVGTHTATMTTKIKELQHFNKFNDIFILALLLLLTNLFVKYVLYLMFSRDSLTVIRKKELTMKRTKLVKKLLLACFALLAVVAITACGKKAAKSTTKPVVIYSNADDEAIDVMKKTLDGTDMKGKYKIQVFGTTELGGKLLSEKTNLEADVITLSTYYLDAAQSSLTEFKVKTNGIDKTENFQSPILGLEGGLIANTAVLKEANLPEPKTLKDLANPIYKNRIAIPNINSSSTAWLMVQALIDTYGEKEAKTILAKILENVGPNLEDSGSGPIKKLRTGEVALGFGLRQQGIVDEQAGLPIKVLAVKEGNYLLTESVGLVKHKTMNANASKVAEILANKTRKDLQTYYPAALYQGEATTEAKRFPKPLTLELLKAHQSFVEKVGEN